MPLRLSAAEWLLERLNLVPVPLLDTPLVPGVGKVLATACELNLFDTLCGHSMTLEELAQCLDCHPLSLRPLLQVLVITGYLRLRRQRYSLRQVARRWLTRGSTLNIAPYVIHSPDIIALWDALPEVVRTNQPARHMPYEEDSERPEVKAALERHYAGLAALAMVLGRELIYRVRLPPAATRLLDVGGSHGAYSALFCRRYPALQATIVDLPPGIEAGKRIVPGLGVGERIDFIVQDLLNEEFPEQLTQAFDCALYFHIAHLLPPESNEQLLKKVAHCLKPGGMLVFVDQITNQEHIFRLGTAMVQMMALTMNIIGGTCYPFATVKGWLEEAGLGSVRLHRLWTPGATLITARK